MSVLDAQVKELKADKIRLQEENKALNNRKSILEKVLALKEEQIQVLQNGAGVRHAQLRPLDDPPKVLSPGGARARAPPLRAAGHNGRRAARKRAPWRALRVWTLVRAVS